MSQPKEEQEGHGQFLVHLVKNILRSIIAMLKLAITKTTSTVNTERL